MNNKTIKQMRKEYSKVVKARNKHGFYKGLKVNVYCDMDGVLADFEGQKDALTRFETEKGFFKSLNPINREGLIQLINNPYINLYILSASPNRQADKDKIAWLKYHYPQIKRKNIIIMRCGKNKADYIKTADGILLDDWGKNVKQWEEKGRKAIKIERPLIEYMSQILPLDLFEW